MFDMIRRALRPPVYVFQMGKVGSWSLFKTIRTGYSALVVQSHRFHEMRFRDRFVLRVRQGLGLPVLVVSPVRDPVTRNISAFFQNFERDTGCAFSEQTWSQSEMIDLFVRNHPQDEPLRWFDEHLCPTFGIDVFATPFPIEEKFRVYTHRSVRVLVYRTDLPHERQLQLVSDLVGRKLTGWVYENRPDRKDYYTAYQKMLKTSRLPADLIHKLVDSSYCRQFWSADECEAFKARWMGASRQSEVGN